VNEPTSGPQDIPEDHEANLFSGASEKAKQLFTESKRVRRAAERRLWWQQNKPKGPPPEGESQ
jgi:hypothetical protein